jgi:hypothetical protein
MSSTPFGFEFEEFDDWDNFEDYFPEADTFGESEYEG